MLGTIERGIETEAHTEWERRSFDPMASVHMLRFDLENVGYIRPNTMERVYDEELTYIAEGINRPLQTNFILQEHNGHLSYFDQGKYRPYVGTLLTGLETAKQEAVTDPRKQFQVERAEKDLAIGYELEALRPGESLYWDSPFPEREAALHGAEFIGSLGYQPARKLGFLYKATRLSNGHLQMTTQSVDNSDGDAFEAARNFANGNQDADLEEILEVYDALLGDKYEDTFFAGRSLSSESNTENAWEVIQQHTDLLEFFFTEIMSLAQKSDLPTKEVERAKKRITYGVWAALKERLDNHVQHTDRGSVSSDVANEVYTAYQILSIRGEELFGCGGVTKGDDALLDADPSKVLDAVFGDKTEVLKCVHCPLCDQDGVDAEIKHHTGADKKRKKTITCSKCKGSKTYDE